MNTSTTSMNPFKAIGLTITSIANTLVKGSGLVEQALDIAGNELTALEEAQQIRLDEVREEREDLKAEREAKRAELKKKKTE